MAKVVARVQCGSWNAETSLENSLAILNIFFNLSRQLLDRMKGVTGVMGSSDLGDAFMSRTGHAEVTEMVFKSAEKRTNEASQKYNSVRMQVFQLGLL